MTSDNKIPWSKFNSELQSAIFLEMGKNHMQSILYATQVYRSNVYSIFGQSWQNKSSLLSDSYRLQKN